MIERLFYLRKEKTTKLLISRIEATYPCFTYATDFEALVLLRISARQEDMGSIRRTLKPITKKFE